MNVLASVVPVLTLGWLALFPEVRVARPDVLAAGALVVVAVNLPLCLRGGSRS